MASRLFASYEVVDAMGPSFVSRLCTELGVPAAAIVRAYRIARDVTGAVGRLAAIDALDRTLDRDVEVELVDGVERLVEGVTRWYADHAPDGAWSGAESMVDRREAARLDILRALERGELDIEAASYRLAQLDEAGPRSFRGFC